MSTKSPDDEVEIIEPPRRGRRRNYSAADKRRILDECAEPGNSVSAVARRYGVSASVVFRWRRLNEEGGMQGLSSEEAVVPESEARELRAQVRELQRLLGKKTLEVEILKEAIEMARPKKLLLRSRLPKPDDGR
jgi:transposase